MFFIFIGRCICWVEKGMATHSGILAWRIPWTEEPDGLQSMGSQRVGHDWVTNTHIHISVRALCKQQKWTLSKERNLSEGYGGSRRIQTKTQESSIWNDRNSGRSKDPEGTNWQSQAIATRMPCYNQYWFLSDESRVLLVYFLIRMYQ